jgi:hypothetical protein
MEVKCKPVKGTVLQIRPRGEVERVISSAL